MPLESGAHVANRDRERQRKREEARGKEGKRVQAKWAGRTGR